MYYYNISIDKKILLPLMNIKKKEKKLMAREVWENQAPIVLDFENAHTKFLFPATFPTIQNPLYRALNPTLSFTLVLLSLILSLFTKTSLQWRQNQSHTTPFRLSSLTLRPILRRIFPTSLFKLLISSRAATDTCLFSLTYAFRYSFPFFVPDL